MSALILHAALPDDWALARQSGGYAMSSRGVTLADEGFIHASTPAQLDGVLDRYYADVDELVVLVLDAAALDAAGSPVRWDPVPGQAEPFPHVYGVIPSSAVGHGNPVIAAEPLRRDAGSRQWPWRPLVSAYGE